MTANPDRWPELPYAAWRETRDTLHLWTQIVGKIRLALTPWLNHSWHVTLYVTARGLTTSPMPWKGGSLEIDFDFIDHELWLRLSDGRFRQLTLRPMIGRGLLRRSVRSPCAELGIDITICDYALRDSRRHPVRPRTRRTRPTTATPPTASGACCSPDTGAQAVPHRLSRQGEPGAFLLGQFRSGGDALLRAAARRCTPAACRICRNAVAREAYSHEVSSAGFWPGSGGPVDYAAFYSYAYPEPDGFDAAKVKPEAAFFSQGARRIYSAL